VTEEQGFFKRFWWMFGGALAAVALATALNITNTDGWIVVTNSSNSSFNIDWNTTKPTVCAAGNYSYWTGTGFLCRDDTTGGSSGGDGTGGWTNTSTITTTAFRVGINETAPNSTLSVRGDINVTLTGQNIPGVTVSNTRAGNTVVFLGTRPGVGSIYLMAAGGNPGFNIIGSYSSAGTDYGRIKLFTGGGANGSAGDIAFDASSNVDNYLQYWNFSNRRVGINKTHPQSTLDVQGNISASTHINTPQLCLNNDCRSVWPLDTYGNVTSLNATKAGTGAVNCGSGTLLQNLTLSSTGVSGQCYTDQTGGGGVSDGNKGDITVASSGAAWYLNNATVGINKFTATGTPSASTFLRGDNTWATPSATGSTSWTNWTSARVNSTSAVVWTTIPNLTTTLSANLNYSVDCLFLSYTNLVTTGEQIRVNFTGTIPVNVTLVYNSQVSATTRTSYGGRNTTADNVFADTGSAGTNLLDIVELTGRVRTGTSAATINYALKSEIAGNNSVIEEGSRCTYGVLS